MQQIAGWWLDYFVIATVLLAAVLIAGSVIRQPVQRMAMAWSSSIALLVAAVCCALPVWPKLAMVPIAHAVVETAGTPVMVDAKGAPQSMSNKEFMTKEPKAAPVESLSAVDLDKRDARVPAKSAVSIASSSANVSIFIYVTTALLSGAVLTLAWLAFGQLRARRICGRAELAPEFAQQELRSLVGTRGGVPRLLISRELSTAGAIGLRRPTILLPSDAIELRKAPGNAADLSLRAVLAHECAHIERCDLWLLAIRRLLLVVLYAHPLYWLARRRVLADQEILADWAAADQCGRHNYAECMVAWARQKPRAGARLDWALGIWERPSQLTQRITMLLNDKLSLRTACSRSWRFGNTVVITLIAGGLSLLTLNPLPQAKAESNTKTASEGGTTATNAPVKKAAQVALPTVTISGECTDQWSQPITNVHVMLFRNGDFSKGRNVPMGRTNIVLTAGQTGAGKKEVASGFSLGMRSATGPRLLAEADVDAAGRFRFADVPVDEKLRSNEESLNVVAQSPSLHTNLGWARVTQKPDGKLSVEPMKLSLGLAESLRGRITNSEGQPVAGAVVWCAAASCMDGPRKGIMCVVTDANGKYEVKDLERFDIRQLPASPTGFGMMKQISLTAIVEHADYAEGIIEYTKVPATADLVLQRPANLRGRVTLDGGGDPAVKSRIQLQDKDSLGGVILTDKDGSFLFKRIAPGKYKIDAELSGRLKHSQEVELVAGDNRLDLQLKSGGIIKGRVVDDATGKPPKFDRSISLEVHACPVGQPLDKTNKGPVNDDGTFIVSVEPGRNALHFVNPQWQLTDKARWIEKGVEVALGETKEVELRVSQRAGGFEAFIAESLAADEVAKGEPASSPPSGTPEMSLDLGDPETDHLSRRVMAFPDELLPVEPIKAEQLAEVLDSLAIVERKTIDGKQCITSIQVGAIEPMSDMDNVGQAIMIGHSVLAHINKYPQLESLLLVGSPGNDKWLESLRGHKTLQSLELVWSKNMTAAGVEHLTTIPNLTHLGMLGPQLNDDALRQFSRMPKLETATFGGVITEKGVAALQGKSQLTALALLGFAESKLTDESLRTVGSLKKLESLVIQHTSGDQPFTDNGLKYLAGSTSLKSLGVGGKGITDAGLVELRQLKRLKNLHLMHTSVTRAGVDDLEKQLPGLKVIQE